MQSHVKGKDLVPGKEVSDKGVREGAKNVLVVAERKEVTIC